MHQEQVGDLKVYVIVTTCDRYELVKRTIDSLTNCDYPNELQAIFVVENGSDAGIRELCADYPEEDRVNYFHTPEPGKGRALNAMVDQLSEGLLILLDDDIKVQKDFITGYTDAAKSSGHGHFFGGPLTADYETEPEQWIREYLPRSAKGWECTNPQKLGKGSDFFLGGNYAVFVRDFKALNGIRTDLGPGASQSSSIANPTAQEVEIQKRLIKNGIKPVYVEKARIWHYVPQERCSEDWVLHRSFRNGLGREILFIESHSNGSRPGSSRRLVHRLKMIAPLMKYAAGFVLNDSVLKFRASWQAQKLKGKAEAYARVERNE